MDCIATHYSILYLLLQAVFVHGVFSLVTGVFYRI